MEHTAHIIRKGKRVNCAYQDYSHKKDSYCNGKKRWRCSVPRCKGKVHTVNEQDDGTATVVYFTPHDHIANPVSLANNQIKAKLIDFVIQKENLHLSIKKVYYKYISQTKFEDEPPSYGNCKTIMHRARHSFLKSVPVDVSNIKATADNHKTISEKDLILEGDNMVAEKEQESTDCSDNEDSNLWCNTKNNVIKNNVKTNFINNDNINNNNSITIKDLNTILDRFNNNSPEKQQNIENKNVNFNKSMLDNSRNARNKRVLNGGTENTQAKKPKTKTTQRLPDIPPPPTFSLSLPPEERDHLYSMLTSWYMSGYHSGYYKCFKEHFAKKKKTNKNGLI